MAPKKYHMYCSLSQTNMHSTDAKSTYNCPTNSTKLAAYYTHKDLRAIPEHLRGVITTRAIQIHVYLTFSLPATLNKHVGFV